MSNPMSRVFARNLQMLLDQRKVTRHELAAATNIPYSTVCGWFALTRFPRRDKLEILSSFFNVPVSALVSEVPEDTTSTGFIRQLFHDDPEVISILDKAAVDINGLPYGSEVPANIKAILRNALLLAAEEVKKIKAEG